ncbi:hypothetical protein ACETIH_02650 [Microvirga arabica]|uniref:DUF892 family protein n=1 Tax=Microvirga arabica TaxID=1128671 RepID=A0ABV6Y2Y8_9HYPH
MTEKSVVRSPKATGSKPKRRRPKGDDLQLCPRDLGSLLAKRTLVLGESEDNYDTLLSKVTGAIKPTDIIESLLVKDITDLAWEAQRWRRLRAEMLTQAGQSALEELLRSIPGAGLINGVQYSYESLAACFAAGIEEAVVAVHKILLRRGLDADTLMARALSNRLDEVERIDRLIAGADARRSRVLDELERRRKLRVCQSHRVADDLDAGRGMAVA